MEARKLIESLKAELTCSICLGYFTDPVTALKCGHNFCKDCLLQCNEQADATLTCPECRAVIRYSDIVLNENLQNLSITGKTLRQHLLQSPALLTTCDQHGEKEKLFCEQDQKLICDSCLLTEEHKDHQVLPLQMAVDKCKKKLQETRNMLQEKEEEYKKAMDELIELDETLKRDSDYFQQLIRSEYKKMHEFLCNEEEINMEELTQEITDNQERFAKMEYSKHVQHFQRILEIKESLDEAPLEILQDMKAILEWNEKVLHQETQQFDFIWESHQMTGLIEILRSYQMNISLDPEIDSLHLIVPEYLKYKRDPQDQSDKEEKLDYFVTVLGIETFSSGKHYWEVDVEGQTEWVLGICEESVSKNKNVSILSKDVRVMIGSKVNDGILFWSPQCCFVSIPTPKVGVFLNYEEGEVSFYDIEDKSNLFSFPNSAFQGPVRPFFSTSLAIKEVPLNHPLPTPATVRRHMRR
ncbi:probable E3 ubiquitin-protein ligase TRIML1 [Monodelphis domestica]|uniref:probable E3 ubiquitin-protein ligase TRIML1 n=1 Tax=Monodelphis domestica TaxID=13616 RepID=UPI0024E1EDF5|nr:probable E3 ubiquitin-protein ligase TRIML1 [Monodelphis domestica]